MLRSPYLSWTAIQCVLGFFFFVVLFVRNRSKRFFSILFFSIFLSRWSVALIFFVLSSMAKLNSPVWSNLCTFVNFSLGIFRWIVWIRSSSVSNGELRFFYIYFCCLGAPAKCYGSFSVLKQNGKRSNGERLCFSAFAINNWIRIGSVFPRFSRYLHNFNGDKYGNRRYLCILFPFEWII